MCLVGASQRDARLSAGAREPASEPPAALHIVALARADRPRRCTTSHWARAESCSAPTPGSSRSPSRRSAERRAGCDLRVQRRGDRSLAPLPAVTAHADRRGHRARTARSSSTRVSGRASSPTVGGRGRGHGLGAAAGRRRDARRARIPLRARPRLRRRRARVRRDAWASSAPTRSSAHACTTPSGAGAARWACWRRSASNSRARSSRTLRCARSPTSSCRRWPTSASSTSWSGDDVRRLVVVNADPEVHEAALMLERYPPLLSSDTPVAVAIRTGDAAGRRIDRRPAGQRLPQPGAPHRGANASASAPCSRRRCSCADARSARSPSGGGRRHRPTRIRGNSPRRSRGASRSRSTTARSTRRRTASASAWPRSYGSCRSA